MSGFNQTPPAAQAERLAQLEEALLLNIVALERALLVAQGARNLLAALTPEGEVERLAARELAALLGNKGDL